MDQSNFLPCGPNDDNNNNNSGYQFTVNLILILMEKLKVVQKISTEMISSVLCF